MPIYDEFYYANGYYGSRVALALSAEPVTATALDYSTVEVTWVPPTGSYSNFRVVRSQRGFPQTQEDGAIIYSSEGAPTTSIFNDTSDNVTAPLVPGRFVFYRVWLQLTSTSDWVQAGDAYTLVPSPHTLGVGRDAKYSLSSIELISGDKTYTTGDAYVYANPLLSTSISTTHDRFMGILPRVITSSTNSGVDVIDDSYDRFSDPSGIESNTLLSKFMSAFSFTLDEFLTFAQLITPNVSVHYSSPTAVFLGSQELGMTQDVEAVSGTQRLLLRNAVQIYSEKGTLAGLQLFIQSLTGYGATLTETTNLMLSHEDATFDIPNWQELYNYSVTNGTTPPAIGNWTTLSSGVTLSVVSNQAPLDSVTIPRSIDSVYCLKVTPSVANQTIGLGTVDPILSGIPVTGGLPYTFSMYAKEGTESEGGEGVGADAVIVTFRWYDKYGMYISSSTGNLTVEGTSWTRYSVANKTAPTNAVYMGIAINFVTQTYPMYLDMLQLEQATDVTTRTNLVTNPSFETDTTGWASNQSTIARSIAQSKFGSYSLLVTPSTNVAGIRTNTQPTFTTGTTYTFSAWVYTTVAKNLKVEAATSGGGSPSTLVPANTWTRLTKTFVAGSTAFHLYVSGADDTQPFYVDGIQLEASSTASDYFDGSTANTSSWDYNWSGTANASTSVATKPASPYVEPRGVIVSLLPTKINYITNPGFQVDTTGWSSTNTSSFSRTTADFVTGIAAVTATANGSGAVTVYESSYIPVTVGQYYSASMYVKDVNTSAAYTVSIKFYNGTTLVSTITGSAVTASTASWKRVSASGKAPAGVTSARLYIQSTTTPSSGKSVKFDAAQFEQAVTPTDYIDGYMTNSGNEWLGDAPSAAYTGAYPARSNRLGRLKKEIEKYIGFGTPYYIDTYKGAYTAGIS